ncbi:MAG: hypothetical protein IKU86_03275 [Thermoguttaceae bacterium]|nr:hypothetical protein [Thermoguttaceae bacterium]
MDKETILKTSATDCAASFAVVLTAEASPMEVALSGSETFRIFDGEKFLSDSAWT